ncbi:SDR family NAD(P)-dependent oxidoreductase [Microbacterium sp. 22215]|uniref:SDR family NAD(P)-dependent oxidoreductase n=1 Tax=Microbacterium sp. 22215 TaxID=3453893 RepID=UPI003F844389
MTHNSTAIIVGAGPGMGSALATAFAARGHSVALIARDPQKLEGLVGALKAAGHTARAYPADAADTAALRAVIEAAARDLGAPEVLVYNAAAVRQDRASELSADQFADTLAVNVVGAKAATDAVLPLLPGGKGVLLYTGGGFALDPQVDFASLSVGKAALRAYVHALAQEVAPRGIHAATVTITGTVDGDDEHYSAAAIADAFVHLAGQSNDDWAIEITY